MQLRDTKAAALMRAANTVPDRPGQLVHIHLSPAMLAEVDRHAGPRTKFIREAIRERLDRLRAAALEGVGGA